MTLQETARAIRAELTKAEAAMAAIDALATDEVRSVVDKDALAKVEAAHARSVKAVGALHRALDKATGASGGVMPKFGK